MIGTNVANVGHSFLKAYSYETMLLIATKAYNFTGASIVTEVSTAVLPWCDMSVRHILVTCHMYASTAVWYDIFIYLIYIFDYLSFSVFHVDFDLKITGM